MSDTKKTRRVHETIVARIEELIRSGEFRCGDRLPPERKLAELFRVSRHAVREAIRALEERQLVKSHIGNGTYVLEGDEASIVEPLAQAIGLGKNKLREIFEVRMLLEPQIAALAARTATAADLDKLHELLETQRRQVACGSSTAEIDDAFHHHLARATGNEVLTEVLNQLHGILAESRSEPLQSPKRAERSLRTHSRILKALEEGNQELAAREMRHHLQQIEQTLFDEPPSSPTGGEKENAP